jgi:hypothetical protein
VEHRFNVESTSVAFSSITTQESPEFLDPKATLSKPDFIIPNQRKIAGPVSTSVWPTRRKQHSLGPDRLEDQPV